MAAKIIFLLALLILPSFNNAQIKEAFSVELKLDKTNFTFGDEVKPLLVIKNISGKIDSLSPNELEDVMTANNLTIFQNSKRIVCEHISSSFVRYSYKVFQPDEILESELELSSLCSNLNSGGLSSFGILDTGFYKCSTYLNRPINLSGKNRLYLSIFSNEIYFMVRGNDLNEKNVYLDLKNILNYTIEQLRDSVYMLLVMEKLDDFVRKNINSSLSDVAFYKTSVQVNFQQSYRDKYLQLAEYYLNNKPDGSNVYFALFGICVAECKKYNNLEAGKRKLEKYIKEYPNTKIEVEAKKILTMNIEF